MLQMLIMLNLVLLVTARVFMPLCKLQSIKTRQKADLDTFDTPNDFMATLGRVLAGAAVSHIKDSKQ